MRSPALAAFPIALAMALAGPAWAGEADPLRTAEARADLFRAEALAAHKLYGRADAVLKPLAADKSPVADEAKERAAAFASERAKADNAPDAPPAYLDAIENSRRSGLPAVIVIAAKDDPTLKTLKPQLDQLTIKRNLIGVAILHSGEGGTASVEARLGKGQNLAGPPLFFFLSPKQEVLEAASGAITARVLSAKWQAASEKVRVDLMAMMKAVSGLTEANSELDARHCGNAARLYGQVIADAKTPATVADEAKASLAAIDELGARLLKEARAAKPAEAVPYLLLLQRDFDGLRAAETARLELDKTRDTPEAKAVLLAASSTIATLPGDDGEEPFRPPAKDTAKEEPSESTEAKAAPRPVKLDPAKTSASLLRIAKALIAADHPDRAKQYLERIAKDYPTTEAGVEARMLLKDMP